MRYYTKFTSRQIAKSKTIQDWLSQFVDTDAIIAQKILLSLNFVSRDSFACWLEKRLLKFQGGIFGFYSVRKLPKQNADGTTTSLWNTDGIIIDRPGSALGSEDFIGSIVKSVCKSNIDSYFDHPSIEKIKEKRISTLVFIDDAIGSGDRISKFIKSFFSHPTLKSLFSMGIIGIKIVSFARNRDSTEKIINALPGKDYPPSNKYHKSEKLTFLSHTAFGSDDVKTRWGDNYESIYSFCVQQRFIGRDFRLGYGKVMSRIIFYHSVPNNIPGILWLTPKDYPYKPLFINKTIPCEIIDILEHNRYTEASQTKENIHGWIKSTHYDILSLIKKGISKANSISTFLEIDENLLDQYLGILRTSGLITDKNRITRAGLDAFYALRPEESVVYDHSLYIPRNWRVV